MAIVFDASSTGVHSGLTHSCAGSDRVLVVETSGSGTLTGVTYGGVGMTSVGTPGATGFGATSSVWYLVAPATGSNGIVFTGTALNMDCEAVSYTGVKQAAPEVVATTASSTSATTWTTTVTTVTDGAWLVFATWSYFFGGPPAAGAGLTLRKIGANHKNGFFDSNGPKSPAGLYSGTTTQGGTAGETIQHVAMVFAPAGTVAAVYSADTNTKVFGYVAGPSVDNTTKVAKELAGRTGEMTARMKKLIKDAGASN